MKLSVPTNLDPALVAGLARPSVVEAYGKLHADVIGGGKPSHLLTRSTWVQLKKHVASLHEAGLRFNYLLNSTSLSGLESTRAGYASIRQLLEQVDSCGADSVTVTVPLLARLVERFHPRLSIRVSAFAGVCTPQQTGYWRDLGASAITLAPTVVNRNGPLLAQLASAGFGVELQLIVNNNCLTGCPHYAAHSNLVSEASRSIGGNRGYTLDHCVIQCRLERFNNPELFLHGDWIRPEDLQVYENIGISSFKVVGRTNPTDIIIQRVMAYSNRSWIGNLAELLEHTRDFRSVTTLGLVDRFHMMRTFFRPALANPLRLREMAELAMPFEPVINLDNQALEGFAATVLEQGCAHQSCGDCRVCSTCAARALRPGPHVARLRTVYEKALARLLDGYYFRYEGNSDG